MRSNFPDLPILAVIDDLLAALDPGVRAVLAAPPGAGKTTLVPLALMDAPWRGAGKIIVLEPRRLAARAAAARMAQLLGEPVGKTVGFRVRAETKVSKDTRIEVVTEGVFTRMILDDPALEGVAAVLFDEFHERSLDADLGLALALQAQSLLREDLRLLVMSATLDIQRVSELMGNAPTIISEGRAYPVDTRYLGRDAAVRLDEDVARAVRRALAEETGSILVFLPGQAEIQRAAERLQQTVNADKVLIAPLYGALTPREQDQAIAPAPPGLRKVVLATAIAETSLTIEGVRVVIDCGFSRVARFDPASGLTRLQTVKVARASADQRRGRAGRTEPGVCYRLWDEAETRGLPPFQRPEILEADLTGLALDLARWGAKSIDDLAFLDPPPSGAWAEARRQLIELDALDAAGELTSSGRAFAELPVPPRLARMMIAAAAAGEPRLGATLASVLSERGLGGDEVDAEHRLERFGRENSRRAADARRLIEGWSRQAERAAKAVPVQSTATVATLLALAFPDRIAKARGAPGAFQLASGRGARLDPGLALARSEYLAVGELAPGADVDRILLAAPLDAGDIDRLFARHIERTETLEVQEGGRLRAIVRRRLGRLVLEERIVTQVSAEQKVRAWLQHVEAEGLGALNFGEACRELQARIAFVAAHEADWPDLSDPALIARTEDWLAPLAQNAKSLAAISDPALRDALLTLVPYDLQRRLEKLAPLRFATPAGPSHAIDYAAEGGPRVEVRVQELFGLNQHPAVLEGRVPLTLSLLSPAHRPVQTTQDLPGFWRGSWKDVRTEMRGRYPRHPWPEDPTAAAPTTRAKPRGT